VLMHHEWTVVDTATQAVS